MKGAAQQLAKYEFVNTKYWREMTFKCYLDNTTNYHYCPL